MKASRVEEVYECFDNNPIKIEDLEEYYINVDTARGLTPIRKMTRL